MEAVALAILQDIAIHEGPSRISSQAIASSPKISDISEIRRHCLNCIAELGSYHREVKRSKDFWLQFSKASAHHEEESTSVREPFPALQRGLEGGVDGLSKVLCRFDHRNWGTISESQWSGRWLADGKVAALAWVKREVPRN